MKIVSRIFQILHALIALLFASAAIMLMIIAARIGILAFSTDFDTGTAQQIIEAIGLLAGAVVALQIAETITEEEVIRDADISGPTRVRRFLSRFFVVIIVALAIEGLVASFKAIHEAPDQLPYAASLIAAVGVLLAAWGVFIRLNRSAEELEPEAMAEAKSEDKKVRRS